MAEMTDSLKKISPQQWVIIAAAGIGGGILWRLHNKSKAAVPVSTSLLDQTAPTAGYNAAYTGASPTGATSAGSSPGTGNVSFTPGGSDFPVALTGFTAPEAIDLIHSLIPTPAAPIPAAAPIAAAPVVQSPAPTPPPPAAPAPPPIMSQGMYFGSLANPDALNAYLRAGGQIAGPNDQGLSSMAQIKADLQNRVNQGQLPPSVLAGL